MFESSTALTTNIAIYPNSGDDWSVLSPFPGETLSGSEEAFVISTGNVCMDGSLHLLPSRLMNVGKYSNNIDFLFKTRKDTDEAAESSGIGGISKLKDFTFELLKGFEGQNNMSTSDILNLYGRTVVLFLSNTEYIEGITDTNKSKIVYKGKIFSAKPSVETISFTVRGLLHTANPLVGGAVVEASDGSISHESLVFGNSGDLYVPIAKKLDDNGRTVLQFSQDDYIIKGLYVKTGSDNEPIFCEINTPFHIDNNEIIFETEEYTSVTLQSSMLAYSGVERIAIQAYYELGIKFVSTPTISVDDICYYYRSGVRKPNRLIYKRIETIDGVAYYIFACGWEFIYGYLRTSLDNDSGCYISVPTGGGGFTNYEVDFVFTGEKDNPIEKERDALPLDYFDQTYDGYELKDYINSRNVKGVKLFQSIPPEGLVIKIDNEEMLVVYTEKDSWELPQDAAPGNPINTYIWVVRGWNNTTKAVHSVDAPIMVMQETKQSIVYTMERPLQSLNTVTPSHDFSFSDFNLFLNGTQDLVIKSYGGLGVSYGEHDPVGFIGLDFKLPNLDGDLQKASILGNAFASFDTSTPATGYDTCFINLALNPVDPINDDTIQLKYSKRRAFGENLACVYNNIFKACMARFSLTGTHIEGIYELALKITSLINPTMTGDDFDDYSHMYGRTGLYNIVDYEDLKKTSMFIIFNTSTAYQKKTQFVLDRPTLKVVMKINLSDVDVYAQLIPKSIFDTPKDTFDVGSNCKICWNPVGQDGWMDRNDILMISDDDSRYFGYVNIQPNVEFGTSQFTANTEGAGILVKNILEYKATAKMYPSSGKTEYWMKDGLYPPYFTLHNVIIDESVNAGKSIVENGNCYIWVDQDNDRLVMVEKVSTDFGNPVRIIQNLLTTYYDDVTINIASFNIAAMKRTAWTARFIIAQEKTLISIIDKIAKEHGLIVYENNIGEISIVALDPPAEDEVARVLLNSEIIYKNRKSIYYSEQFTQLDYLITKMDVYYNYLYSKYQNYIESDNLSCQDNFTIAQQYSENEIKVKLNLQTIYEQFTADQSAVVKMAYHQIPTRILDIKTLLSIEDIEMGQWVSCNSSKIPEISGKIYLCIKHGMQVPFPGKKPYGELKLFEYDWDSLVLQIQEVPLQSINENYDEIPECFDDIDEIPDV